MATDYILFVHGVNTRETTATPAYADKLFELIKKNVGSSLQLKKVALYWGDVNQEAEDELLGYLKDSPDWQKFWFRDFREKNLLHFVGDAALYISSHVGYLAVHNLKEQAIQGLAAFKPGDRLHLVTHSWGTIILFDMLFAGRWDFSDRPGYDDVKAVRDFLYGLEPNPQQGIRLASIHTMGSPISLFTLMTVTGENSHDLIPKLKQLLENLYKLMGGKKLPWQNYAHPGDPVAWPLATVMPKLVDSNYVDIQDVITQDAGWGDLVTEPVKQTALALVHGGDAHGSYLKSQQVAQKIAETIKQVAISS